MTPRTLEMMPWEAMSVPTGVPIHEPRLDIDTRLAPTRGYLVLFFGTSSSSSLQIREVPAPPNWAVTSLPSGAVPQQKGQPNPALSTSDAITEIRRLSGLTFEQIASLFGVSRRTVHLWATGERPNAGHEAKLLQVVALLRDLYMGDAARTRMALLLPQNGRTPLDLIREGNLGEARRRLEAARSALRRTRPTPSKELLEERKPLPPWTLVSAIPDAIPPSSGRGRGAKAVRSKRRGQE